MSLDERMRVIAREESASASGRELERMRQQIEDLHEHLHQVVTRLGELSTRLEAVENAPVVAAESGASVRRSSPKGPRA